MIRYKVLATFPIFKLDKFEFPYDFEGKWDYNNCNLG
jgi:hypothetical protein